MCAMRWKAACSGAGNRTPVQLIEAETGEHLWGERFGDLALDRSWPEAFRTEQRRGRCYIKLLWANVGKTGY
jgi:TolB-like protein